MQNTETRLLRGGEKTEEEAEFISFLRIVEG